MTPSLMTGNCSKAWAGARAAAEHIQRRHSRGHHASSLSLSIALSRGAEAIKDSKWNALANAWRRLRRKHHTDIASHDFAVHA